jgi:hypothetical protein
MAGGNAAAQLGVRLTSKVDEGTDAVLTRQHEFEIVLNAKGVNAFTS